ncbi:MAG: hypothetical protein C5B50_23210 [Verrucomicrobia bacterium]|nr:MAG: hypothetical protein C5B50_23210 [Verrucomicrobiota bacterium]
MSAASPPLSPVDSQATGSKWPFFIAYVLVPLATGLWVIAGVCDTHAVLPIDNGDEPGETFVQVPMALSELARGHILKINLFNNFGTPLLGEPVSYPFAVHAWTYALFRPVVAMIINKFVLAVLTMIVLTLFFRRYFQPLISSLCTFLSFSAPQFFHFFQNHPHQGALLYFGALLVAVRRFLERPCASWGLCVYAASLIFLFSVGINGAILGVPFFLAYVGLLAGRRWRLAGLVAGVFCAAFIAVGAHYREFFRLASESARRELNYQALTAMAPLDFLTNILWHRPQYSVEGQLISFVEVFYSWPVVILILVGLVIAVRSNRRGDAISLRTYLQNQDQRLAAPISALGASGMRPMILLGLLPCLGVILLRLLPGLAASLPLVRAANIVRILWFSDIFLMLAVGVAISWLFQLLARKAPGWRVLAVAALGAALLARLLAFDRERNAAATNEELVLFQPQSALPLMKPYTRIAAFTDPMPLSADTKAGTYHLLGSAGRSIILNKAFEDYLLANKVIRMGYHGMTYFFVPAKPETLAFFGIRYGLRYCDTSEPDRLDEQMTQSGWRKARIQEFETQAQDGSPRRFYMVLFISPVEVTPFYISQGSDLVFLQNYSIEGNEIQVQLPVAESTRELTATFLARPGWKAAIEGQPVPIEQAENQFIRVRVPGSNAAARVLDLKYEPYSDAFLIGSVIVSMAAGLALCGLVGRLARIASQESSFMAPPGSRSPDEDGPARKGAAAPRAD